MLSKIARNIVIKLKKIKSKVVKEIHIIAIMRSTLCKWGVNKNGFATI